MKNSREYPHFKVIFWFSICPFLVSGFIASAAVIDGAGYTFGTSLGIFFAILFFGILYLPPAIVLAVIYSVLRIKKNIFGILFVSLFGGIGASIWGAVFFGNTENLFEFLDLNLIINAGAFSSLIVGLIVLPSK